MRTCFNVVFYHVTEETSGVCTTHVFKNVADWDTSCMTYELRYVFLARQLRLLLRERLLSFSLSFNLLILRSSD